jgi:hypothetical protein
MLAGEPPVRMVVALHCGTVIYGNIGAAARLDFTVIGPAVNLVSRVETVAKALDLPIVVSEAFARAPMGAISALSVGMNCGALADRMNSSRPNCHPLARLTTSSLRLKSLVLALPIADSSAPA